MSGRFDTPVRSGLRGTRKIRQRVRTDNGLAHTYTWVDVGHEEYTYEVNLDWHQIMREMAERAAHSRGNQCHAGPVQVRITGRKRI